MAEYHRTDALTIVGGQPEIKKLWNGRLRLTYFCEKKDNDDTDFSSLDRIFPEFGSLHSAPLSAEGQQGQSLSDRQKFPDMLLVECANDFIPATSGHNVVLVYETITASFVQEKDDDTKQGASNLRNVSRSVIAIAETPYANVVGATTIQHTVVGLGEVTLYLASAEIDDTDAYRRVKEVWAEAGKISESDPLTGADRLRVKTVVWQMIQGTSPTGYVASATKTDNIGGFKTITVSYYLGDDLSTSYVYDTTVPFSMPGTVDYATSSLSATTNNQMLDITSPVRTICAAEITESYTTTPTVDIASVYQPNLWANVIIEGIGLSYRAFSTTSTYNNHIALSTGTSATAPTLGGTEFIQGNRLFGGTTGYIRISGPTDDPAGTTITINIDVQPVFRLLDGTQYYKKVVTNIDVPARG